MKRSLPALLCLAGALAGCEEPAVSNVARREMITAKHLAAMQEAGGAVFVEIHGAPWPGADPAEVAGTLRMPEGPGRGVRFRPVPPGQGLVGDGERLVMLFNPKGKPDSGRDCRAESELETASPPTDGFTVQATFCRGTEWVIRASFRARDVAQDDWLAYYLRMQELMDALFPNA